MALKPFMRSPSGFVRGAWDRRRRTNVFSKHPGSFLDRHLLASSIPIGASPPPGDGAESTWVGPAVARMHRSGFSLSLGPTKAIHPLHRLMPRDPSHLGMFCSRKGDPLFLLFFSSAFVLFHFAPLGNRRVFDRLSCLPN